MQKVLLVEDSIDSQELVISLLKNVCEITAVPSVAQALKVIETERFELILMDVNLEDGDGFTLTSIIKQNPLVKNIPVIFITSQDDIDAKTKGFHLGAEDYIVKPFNFAEFKLRVESKLKKSSGASAVTEIERGNFRIDIPRQRVLLIKENKSIDLTPLEFKIFYYLVEQSPGTVNREKLMSHVWGQRVNVGRSIDTHVNSLRKKMGIYSGQIKSIYGQGYRFSPDLPVKDQKNEST